MQQDVHYDTELINKMKQEEKIGRLFKITWFWKVNGVHI